MEAMSLSRSTLASRSTQGKRLRRQHLGADVRFVFTDALPPFPEHGVCVFGRFLIGQPIRAFHLDLVVTTQIDHVGEPESKQHLDIALSQDPGGCRRAAARKDLPPSGW